MYSLQIHCFKTSAVLKNAIIAQQKAANVTKESCICEWQRGRMNIINRPNPKLTEISEKSDFNQVWTGSSKIKEMGKSRGKFTPFGDCCSRCSLTFIDLEITTCTKEKSLVLQGWVCIVLPCGTSLLNRLSSLFFPFEITGVKGWHQLQITNILFDSHGKNKYNIQSFPVSPICSSVSSILIIKAERALVKLFHVNCHSFIKSEIWQLTAMKGLAKRFLKVQRK